ncbi:MAG TPA: helix-turn-helix domain-containing protein [Solirubrobacteraceae bacterium]
MSRDVEILQAAAVLFRQRGYDAVGVDEIGQAVGVTGPAIYRHFSGKDEILGTLFDEGMDEVFRVTSNALDDPFESLEHIVREHALHVLRNPVIAGVWIHESRALTAEYKRRYRRRAERYVERWMDVLRRCYPEAPEATLLTITHSSIGSLNSVNSWPRELRDETNVETLVALVMRGADALAGARA